MSLVGVVTNVTSAITGAVVSVVVVVLSVVVEDVELSPEPSSLLVQPDTRINNSNRTKYEKRFEKLFLPTLLDIKINLSIFKTYKGI